MSKEKSISKSSKEYLVNRDTETRRHTQNTDTFLDRGGPNELSAEQIKNGLGSDLTDVEIKTKYENNPDTNAFTDSEKTKLGTVETGAEVNQTDAEIKTQYEANANTNEFSDNEKTKLSGIEEGAEQNVGNEFNNSGTYASLRAQATTKGDVGLGNVPNIDHRDFGLGGVDGSGITLDNDSSQTTGFYSNANTEGIIIGRTSNGNNILFGIDRANGSNPNKVFINHTWSNTWQGENELYHTGNKPSASDVGAVPDNLSTSEWQTETGFDSVYGRLGEDVEFAKIYGTESRGRNSASFPVGRESVSGENLYPIETSWSTSELRRFMSRSADASDLHWGNESDAPSGYTIKVDGGGVYSFKRYDDVGAPLISLEEGAVYYFEFWFKVDRPNTKVRNYVGTTDYDENLNIITGNNYLTNWWQEYSEGWVKHGFYFDSSHFSAGTKHFTPGMLMCYRANDLDTGTESSSYRKGSYSGFKLVKVSNSGNRTFRDNLRFDGSLESGSTTVIDSSQRIYYQNEDTDQRYGRLGEDVNFGKITSESGNNFIRVVATNTSNNVAAFQLDSNNQLWQIGTRDGSNTTLRFAPTNTLSRSGFEDATVIQFTTDGTILASGNVTAGSDERLKKDISVLKDASSIAKAIESVRYTWKKSGEKAIGVIAQQVEDILPEVVHTDEKGYKAVDYGKLSSVLFGAFQEQQETIEKQQDKIDSLEQRLERLESKLGV